MASLIILGEVRPHETRSANRGDYLNEVFLMMAIYNIFCFTDWIGNLDLKFYSGYCMILLVSGHFCIGILSMTFETLGGIKHDFRVKWVMWKYKHQRKQLLADLKADHDLVKARMHKRREDLDVMLEFSS